MKCGNLVGHNTAFQNELPDADFLLSFKAIMIEGERGNYAYQADPILRCVYCVKQTIDFIASNELNQKGITLELL